MNRKTTIYITTLIVSNSFLFAVDEIKVTDVEKKYTDHKTIEASEELKQSINLGFANTSGNTETMNVNGKYSLSMKTAGLNSKELKTLFNLTAFYSENNSTKTTEEFTSNLDVEQIIGNSWLGYASLNWLRNEFKNYDNKYSLGAGIGKEIYKDDKQSLKLKLGVAYNIEDYSDNTSQEEFGSLNEYIEYNNDLNRVSDLYIKIGSLQNFEDFSDDYEAILVAGLNFAVGENVNLTIEEEVSYDNEPSKGLDKTDTKTVVRVGYNF